jgi:hypothetical protein
VDASGLFSADAVRRLVAKCEKYVDTGLGEGDEMGLMGVLSTLLLKESMVDHPTLAAPATPNREVVGDVLVSAADGAHGAGPGKA